MRKNNRGRRHARGDRACWSSPEGLLRESHLTREKGGPGDEPRTERYVDKAATGQAAREVLAR
jgi:hypothetical protein